MHPLDFLKRILKKLIYHNKELESISIQGKTDVKLYEMIEIVRKIKNKRNFKKKINKEIIFNWIDAVL